MEPSGDSRCPGRRPDTVVHHRWPDRLGARASAGTAPARRAWRCRLGGLPTEPPGYTAEAGWRRPVVQAASWMPRAAGRTGRSPPESPRANPRVRSDGDATKAPADVVESVLGRTRRRSNKESLPAEQARSRKSPTTSRRQPRKQTEEAHDPYRPADATRSIPTGGPSAQPCKRKEVDRATVEVVPLRAQRQRAPPGRHRRGARRDRK